MSHEASRRALSVLLTVMGITAVTTGLWAVITGTGGMPGDVATSPSTESELRYFAAFWIAYGAAALLVAPRAERETAIVRGLALAMFVGSIARAVAWIDVGRPHDLFVGLMVAEVVVPALIVTLQARVAARR